LHVHKERVDRYDLDKIAENYVFWLKGHNTETAGLIFRNGLIILLTRNGA